MKKDIICIMCPNGCKITVDYEGSKILIKVDNSVKAVQKLAVYERSKINIPVIAVTGSVGKTTTREMITAALSAKKKVYSTKGNSNSQIGVPKTVFEFDDDADIAVLELGMSMPGEMQELARGAIYMMPTSAIEYIEIAFTMTRDAVMFDEGDNE